MRSLATSRCDEIIKPFLQGREVRRYAIDPTGRYLIYTFHGVDISRYRPIEEYLRPFKQRLLKRATKQAWYELQQPQFKFAPYMEGPKIIFPDIATTPRFTLDTEGYYGANTVYFIPRKDLYLLALLNSSVANFYFRQVCAGLEGKGETYLRFFGQYLEGFPVPLIPSDNPHRRELHRNLEDLAQTMLTLHHNLRTATTPRTQTSLRRQIEATDREIDALSISLYQLDPATQFIQAT